MANIYSGESMAIPPFKVEEFFVFCLTRGSPIGCTIVFNFEGGMARDSPEYVFAIRLVINDQCGLHIETLQL